jgi:hypothetical protein
VLLNGLNPYIVPDRTQTYRNKPTKEATRMGGMKERKLRINPVIVDAYNPVLAPPAASSPTEHTADRCWSDAIR